FLVYSFARHIRAWLIPKKPTFARVTRILLALAEVTFSGGLLALALGSFSMLEPVLANDKIRAPSVPVKETSAADGVTSDGSAAGGAGGGGFPRSPSFASGSVSPGQTRAASLTMSFDALREQDGARQPGCTRRLVRPQTHQSSRRCGWRIG